MSQPGTIVKAVKSATSVLPKVNPARIKKPSPIPLRPLRPDRFRIPIGEKQIFLPNFTLALLRTPLQPAHFASFFTPLWMNKLDLKDYLYNLYGVQALRVRSYVINGKVYRDPKSRRLFRKPQKKKMTIEMAPGDNFVWPDVPKDLTPWDKELADENQKEKEGLAEGRTPQGQDLRKVARGEKASLKEQARALLGGRAKWRPGWDEYGTGTGPLGTKEARM